MLINWKKGNSSVPHPTVEEGKRDRLDNGESDQRGGIMLKFHGISSLLLIVAACALGCFQIFNTSNTAGAVYIGVFLLAYSLIFVLFCSKCPADIKTCPHVISGALKRVFPVKRNGDYTKFDYGITALSVLAMVLFPQYWLKNNIALFIAFWIMIVIAVFQIRTSVCTGCCNKECGLCRNTDNRKTL